LPEQLIKPLKSCHNLLLYKLWDRSISEIRDTCIWIKRVYADQVQIKLTFNICRHMQGKERAISWIMRYIFFIPKENIVQSLLEMLLRSLLDLVKCMKRKGHKVFTKRKVQTVFEVILQEEFMVITNDNNKY
jgi:hypothetical protein